MNLLLDTCAVSEPRKKRPNDTFVTWLYAQDPATLFVSALTLAEAWQGFCNLADDHPDRRKIREFVEGLPEMYRVLKFDDRAAAEWGRITRRGLAPLPLRDSLVAAVALSRSLIVVTRDVQPFRSAGCRVVSPWD